MFHKLGDKVSIAPTSQLFRIISIGLSSIVLVGFGLVVSGKTATATNIYRSMISSQFAIDPIPGSKVGHSFRQDGLSGPQWNLACEINATSDSVIEHYTKVAKAQAVKAPSGESFHIVGAGPGFQSVIWIDKNDRRLGVVAMGKIDGISTRYQLFEAAGYSNVETVEVNHLPLGVEAPRGSRAYFDFRGPEQSYGLFESPWEPGKTYRMLSDSARSSGATVELEDKILDKAQADSGFRSLAVVRGDQRVIYSVQKVGVGKTRVTFHTSKNMLKR